MDSLDMIGIYHNLQNANRIAIENFGLKWDKIKFVVVKFIFWKTILYYETYLYCPQNIYKLNIQV